MEGRGGSAGRRQESRCDDQTWLKPAKAKASTSRWKLRLQLRKSPSGLLAKGKLHGHGNAHQSFLNSEEGGRSKDDRQSKEAQQSKRFKAGSIDSPDPEGKFHSRPGVTSFTSGLFHGQGYTLSCVHGLTFSRRSKSPLAGKGFIT